MNPPSSNSFPAGFNFYRDEKGLFNCPVHDCGKSYRNPDSLTYHISKTHIFSQHPQPQHAQTIPQNTTGRTPSQSPRAVPLTPPTDGTNNNRNMATPGPQLCRVSGHPTVQSPLSQSQPLTIPHKVQLPQDQSWFKSIVWPPRTAALLKTLIIDNSSFGPPLTTMEHSKLLIIFGEFYNKVDFPSYQPQFDDERLWLLFKAKVADIQAEMLKSGEVYETKQGLKLSKLPPNPLPVESRVPAPISTLPTTPILPSDTQLDGIKFWNSLDADAQAKLIRDQLRTAKDSQHLIYQIEQYCAEFRRKEQPEGKITGRRSQSVGERRVEANKQADNQVQVISSGQSPLEPPEVLKPFVSPPPASKPLPSKPNDLKSMIEARLREAELKRKRANKSEKDSEETQVKKVKVEVEPESK